MGTVMKRVIAIACVAVLSIMVSGCGSDSPVTPATEPGSKVDGDLDAGSVAGMTNGSLDPRAAYWEPLIRSESYTGQIAVMFKEEAGVRFGGGPFRSTRSTDLTALNQLFAQHPEVTIRLGLPNITQDELDQRVQEIRVNEGYPMTDWASFYMIDVMDADEAVEILSGLYQFNSPLPSGEGQGEGAGLVWFAHPIPRAYPAGIKVPTISPGPGQDYLKDLQSTGGLNVKAAWDQELDGSNVAMIDVEGNWNINHNDLQLSESSFISTDSDSNLKLDKFVQHGTAVAGVVVGWDNGVGITGIAPKTKFLLGQTAGTLPSATLSKTLAGGNQAKYADGPPESGGMKPGDLFVIEMEVPKPGATSGCGGTATKPSDDCVPFEAYELDYNIIKDLVNYGGIVVVEGGGNGGVNLDKLPQGLMDLSTNSTGALMVGASMGGSTLMNGKHTLEKAPFSNCGSRVDVFAWGAGVVTTGYGDHPISVKDDPDQWYTASFGGTSSATAMIAGAAALLQQYTRQLYTDPKSVCKIKSEEYVYLSSEQMREVMVASGTAAKAYVSDPDLWEDYKDPNPLSGGLSGAACPIGKQPDLGKALQLIKDGCCAGPDCGGIKPTVLTKDVATYCPEPSLQNPEPPQAAWCPDKDPIQAGIGKMMDLDGDGRADLISFSRDRKWYIDLSSTGDTLGFDGGVPAGKAKDNFGKWDLVFDLSGDTSIAKDAMLFPVVMDYDTDGKPPLGLSRADLGLYDAVHGKWYVHFTTGATLTTAAVKGINPWPGWDMVLDYSTQPHWQPYSRPVPGDYNGQDEDVYKFDHYMDLALQTPDGWWLIDLGGQNPNAHYGAFDNMKQYVKDGDLTYETLFTGEDKVISNTPAWACLPLIYPQGYGFAEVAGMPIMLKTPDDVGQTDITNRALWSGIISKLSEYGAIDYGDNAIVYSRARFQTQSFADMGIKHHCGNKGFWLVATAQSEWDDIIPIDPNIDFGGIDCRPIPGDYDGDGYDDRAVQCGNVWKINYSNTKSPSFPINHDTQQQTTDCDGNPVLATQKFRLITHAVAPKDPLPGYVYPGGVTFKETKEIVKTVDYLCPTVAPNGSTPPCTLLNMTPAPVSPYFPQCVEAVRKQYKTDPCTSASKKVACEEMRIQQAQCVWDY